MTNPGISYHAMAQFLITFPVAQEGEFSDTLLANATVVYLESIWSEGTLQHTDRFSRQHLTEIFPCDRPQ